MKETFVFVGRVGCIGPHGLIFGGSVELDPGYARERIDNGFPLIPASMFRDGMTQAEALIELEKVRNPAATEPTPEPVSESTPEEN
jgi:hypothetical protein